MNEDVEVIVCSMDDQLKEHGIHPPIGKIIIKIDKKRLKEIKEMLKNEKNVQN